MSVVEKLDQIMDFLKQLKPVLENLLKDSENQNAIAAKIINEISNEMKKCHCNKEILDAINQEKSLVPKTQSSEPKETTSGLAKYTWPNYGVGNAELGSSGNPDALQWPSMEPVSKDKS